MLKKLKRASLQSLKHTGIFGLVRDSEWRRQRLLILCYHSISLEDEHQWRPPLSMPPDILEQRLLVLRDGGYNVLPLGEGLQRLYANDLPPRAVAITFDDGFYNFYRQAYPLLKRFGFRATVYQTTYYTDYPRPVFNLICSYMLWKCREKKSVNARALGFEELLDLTTEGSRQTIVDKLVNKAAEENLTGVQQNRVAGHLADLIGIDYEKLVSTRVLQLMNPAEVAELAQHGIDFQLHTHRHRTPRDEGLFQREIRENRDQLKKYTGLRAVHLCYPSGVYYREYLDWLPKEDVISATTCNAGLATRQSHPLLLPRFVDTSRQTSIEFESWLTGIGELIAKAQGVIERGVRSWQTNSASGSTT